MKNNFLNRIIAITCFMSITMSVNAQVKIGANPTVITSTSALEVEATGGSKMVVDKTTGRVGIGVTAPLNALHVEATANPLKVVGLQAGQSSDLFVSTDANGVFHTLNATKPQMAAVKLTSIATVSRGAIGGNYHFPTSTTLVNTIPGATIATNGDITLPAGTYQVVLTVDGGVASDATPPTLGFYIHSYFYDFLGTAGVSRIHNNTPGNLGTASNHGISISYITTVNANTVMPFQIGWGQGGNVATSANLSFASGCQLSITKLI